ncbi:5'-methylthioadenosine/adenosylhomocysteine nucleosidase [Bordetella sp. 15P40C-2]|uniref:5'-methylthioadenosine/adenosylhomocysteine nucleosidase n=1 Tax=Bordetella sp. 15P40C-2 TaxID=2572246 RepID=UPI001328DF8E|nr:5'-methylthioadenosine/adenosylhomocysteine nucleosidase [Bordetella sp. 15P40C-2]MVW72769.1 5'-methylthioadenosine/adenosylhomocysteine nucleosidase [Bordetella sp. 15P40C-2]
MAAMPKELEGLVTAMGDSVSITRIAMRDFYVGEIAGCPCVVVLSRIGKVAAAATTTVLIETFKATSIVFVGLAGGLHSSIRVGDIVVASLLMQHDLDARPLFARYEVPMLGLSRFTPDASLSAALLSHARAYLAEQSRSGSAHGVASVDRPSTAHHGLIVTGDVFVSEPSRHRAIQQQLPDALCVEMEGAAMAQVCFEFGVPFAVMRVISDHADHNADVDLSDFLEKKASLYTCGVLFKFLATLR